MAEAGTSKGPVTSSDVISRGAALAELRGKREADGTRGDNTPVNSVSEAARALGQRAAEVRAQRAAPATVQGADKQQPAAKTQAPQANGQAEQPEEEAEDNADQDAAPEGHEAEEGQIQDEAETDDGGRQEPTITIDGEKLTATEIKESYLRRADYTKKTTELAQRGQVLEQSLGVVTQNSQRIEQLVGMLEQAVGQEPDWTAMAMQYGQRPNGAMEFLAYKENWNQQKAVLNNVRREKEQNYQQSLAQAKSAMFSEYAAKFRPEWQDRGKMQEGTEKLGRFALEQGIFPEELQMMYRVPMMRILDLAHQQVELQNSAKVTDRIVRGKPKPVRPGSNGTRVNAAESTLNQARQVWESGKHPDSRAAGLAWLRAKATYEQQTGKRVPK